MLEAERKIRRGASRQTSKLHQSLSYNNKKHIRLVSLSMRRVSSSRSLPRPPAPLPKFLSLLCRKHTFSTVDTCILPLQAVAPIVSTYFHVPMCAWLHNLAKYEVQCNRYNSQSLSTLSRDLPTYGYLPPSGQGNTVTTSAV